VKPVFEVKERALIEEILDRASYGTLALCDGKTPYSVPINFVRIGEELLFHGAKRGRKMQMLERNPFASFSVVESYAIIPSYFSSKEGLACPATHFFKSVVAEGSVRFVTDREEKAHALEQLMRKLQPEGKYHPLDDDAYTKAIDATAIFALKMEEVRAKFKLGQHLTRERFEMILEHLQKRGNAGDLATIEMMKRISGSL